MTTALIDQARRLGQELEAARSLVGELAGRRSDVIRAAVDAGMTQKEIAEALGISRQAVTLALMPPDKRRQNRRGRRPDGPEVKS